jgi:hypothetical protein
MAEFCRVRISRLYLFIIVIHRIIIRMAREYGLYLKYKEEFHEVFEEHQDHSEFGPLMVRMKVVEKNGESSMNEDQWEAASECTFAKLKVQIANKISAQTSISHLLLRKKLRLVIRFVSYLSYNILFVAFAFGICPGWHVDEVWYEWLMNGVKFCKTMCIIQLPVL